MEFNNKLFEEVYNFSHLTEITAAGFANSLRRTVFNNNEIDSPDAALSAVQNARKAAQQAKYERVNGEIIKNGATHLQRNDGTFCSRAEFMNDFSEEKFASRPDLAGDDTANVMVNEYLTGFNDNGWLISLVDQEGYDKIIAENI